MSSTDLPPITLLLQEIQAVTSAMRRNQRWASATSLSTPSSQPLPPYLQASRLARRSRASSQSNFNKKRGSSEGVEEGDLMDGFVELRRLLTGTNDVTTLDPLSLVQPFLALIRSSLTSGVITSLSLLSLHSIILNILPAFLTPLPTSIAPSTPLQIALAHTTATLSQCRFPSSSPQQDELVLLRLLRVIESLSLHFPLPNSSGTSSMLDQMGDESVCELLEVGLGMLARARLGEGLRNTAQSCVQTLVKGCFTRLRRMSPEDMQRLMQAGTVVTVETKIGPKVKEQSPVVDASEGSGLDEKTIEGDLKSSKPIEPSRPPFSPHGLPTILELLRVLIALLNPSDQAHTDSMRLSALAILNTALEVGGTSLGRWPELREGVRDEGCRYLFQLTRSDSPALLTQSLRTTSTLFSTMLPHLKLQLELFLSYLIDRLTPPTPPPFPQIMTQSHSRPVSPVSGAVDGTPDPQRSKQAGTPSIDMHTPGHSTPKPISLLPPVPGETKELMLETLSQIALRPSFMVDCWTNFDCSTESENIFERLISFLTRGVYPSGPPKADGSTHIFEGLENTQLLSLEILLTYVASMASRLEHGGESWPSQAPPAQLLDERKSRKGVLLTGAAMFNAKPKNGLAYLEKNGIIVPEPGEGNVEERRLRAIAQFLRHSTRLDKKLLGEYISRPDQLDLLKAFIGLFDFKGKSIADAMRELLETFRLPGESQPISRITETFAEHFISFNPPEIASQDAVYVLAYSVIMLNTDLHNPQNRKRMTIDDYKRNLRGVNDGKDFDPEYLAAIHESIKKREIILPEEHVGQPGFDYAWKGLMQRSRTAGPMIVCNTSVFDEAMFRASWRPLISAIAYAFTLSAQDEHVIQRAITGFRQCASLAGHFHLPEVFDTIVQSLAPATGLLEDSNDDYQMTNYPVVDKDNTSLTVSPLSVRFGQSYRSQLTTVVLFTIANGNGNAIRQGWGQIFEMFQTLFIHSLLPPPMLQMEDFLAGTSMIPMKTAAPAPVPERRPEGGLLSTLSSYLLSPYGASEDRLVVETSDEDVENTLVAVDCLSSCKLEELYAEILHLEVEALIPALKALRSLAEARTTGRLAARNELRAENSPGLRHEGQLPYDPTCVFHLEMMVSLASRGKPHIAETWPITFEYISSLLSSAQSYSVLLIERAVVGLLRLCLVVSETADLRDQLYIALDVLRSLPSTVLNAVSEQLMAGIAKILEKDSSVVKSHTEWGLIIALFRATVAHPEASKVTLAIVQKMAAGGDSYPGLSEDNYAGVVALLDEFATAAGAAGVGRGRRASQSATLGPTVERGLSALDSLYGLRNVIPDLMESSGLSGQDGWNTFWLPPLLAISKQCVNIHHSIRQRAIAHLQRLLTSPQLLSTEQALATIFDRVLFPIMDELLKPQVYERDPSGMGETRLRAATLLCKVFLQYVVRLAEGNLISGMFVRVLDRLERFMKGEKEMLNEATESLKNVILVMYSSDLLLPPPSSSDIADTRTKEQREIWTSGAERIERVLPGFLAEAMKPTEPQRSSPVKSGTTVA
ncbi:hypothetical protein TREMEDRAFT_41874 [Tremella mesenterica DSM 1558]|uniref:uncharacterized protein n=1 Tax=Tremella mesenterica (strain ATCC 24925 / CBS 8224 / DSM 1558 / NBRC 9311 / NRRL Y-6157 / RJB 2259-6 / UBC 559-6) TaxID=578456 RepID=UPI0003F4928C|nr:uncharacterized protein TREMEDRAFT_41874 [Tremella mesenterica DSM 1558]EIW72629.1 hypothetical protein TREMEDRAFT_41874 [Tremella mesenterica DSM 1558]